MNYQRIHDSIIDRALHRNTNHSQVKYESHHIKPVCEGGLRSGQTVLLTQKEHRIIHKLRYKFTGVLGNILAYNLMKYGRDFLNENHRLVASKGGFGHHEKMKNEDPEKYRERQSNSGKVGGTKCYENGLGFFAMSEDQMKKSRKRGTKTLVENKIGMFSDEFRKQFRIKLQKKVLTPDGIFDSMILAAKHYGVSCGTITYRVNNEREKWNEWRYV